MKANDLIARLQREVELYGDCDVVCENRMAETEHINNVVVLTQENPRRIILEVEAVS